MKKIYDFDKYSTKVGLRLAQIVFCILTTVAICIIVVIVNSLAKQQQINRVFYLMLCIKIVVIVFLTLFIYSSVFSRFIYYIEFNFDSLQVIVKSIQFNFFSTISCFSFSVFSFKELEVGYKILNCNKKIGWFTVDSFKNPEMYKELIEAMTEIEDMNKLIVENFLETNKTNRINKQKNNNKH